MRLALASQGLNNALRHLANFVQINNISISSASRMIGWNNRDPGILKDIYYPLEYQYLLDRHQYSLLLSDGSFFQFFYQFDAEDSLSKGRLAYYPRPIPTIDTVESLLEAADEALDREDEQLYEHLFNQTEELEVNGRTPSNTSHIRFDFDREVTVHSQSHLQFGAVHEWRVPAGFFPQPLAFVQLCESLLHGIEPLESAALGFERNNSLAVPASSQLISLSCQN